MLPQPPRPLVGRGAELAALEELFAGGARLVRLTGPGGVGKTRLALAAAERLAARYRDGLRWVDLAPLADPALVLPALAAALGVREAPGQPLGALVARALSEREALVVLDNCEHLLAAAPALGDLLAAAPGLRLLATSREPLGLRAEQLFPVAPLALPDERRAPSPDVVGAAPAVALFVQQAQAARPTFALDEANAAAVAAICRRVDGLPLAIELAAARVRHFPPAQLLARMADRLDVLAGRERDRPARHRTVHAAVAWTVELLPPAERSVFRDLAVFAESCSLEAAEVVCGEGEADVAEALASLVDKGLLLRLDDPREARYRLLEPIREHARGLLEASGRADAVARVHARYFLGMAEAANRERYDFHERASFDRIGRDHANLRAALGRSIASGDAATAARLVGVLWVYWFARGHLSEGRAWVDRVLAMPGLVGDDAAAGRVHLGAACLAYRHGDLAAAAARAADSLALARERGDTLLTARSEVVLGLVDALTGRPTEGEARLERGLAGMRAAGDPFWSAVALGGLGMLATATGDLATAGARWEAALAIQRAAGDQWGPAEGLYRLGVLGSLAGDGAGARARLLESAAIYLEMDDRWGLARAVEALGWVQADAGADPALAARLLGASGALRASIGLDLLPDEAARHERTAGLLRARLGDAAYEAAGREGAALPPEQVVELAEAVAPAGGRAPSAAEGYGLTEREREIAALIGRGLTSKEIAERLVISEATADTHAARIRSKLGLRSRAEIAAWAVRQGIADGGPAG